MFPYNALPCICGDLPTHLLLNGFDDLMNDLQIWRRRCCLSFFTGISRWPPGLNLFRLYFKLLQLKKGETRAKEQMLSRWLGPGPVDATTHLFHSTKKLMQESTVIFKVFRFFIENVRPVARHVWPLGKYHKDHSDRTSLVVMWGTSQWRTEVRSFQLVTNYEPGPLGNSSFRFIPYFQ